MRGSAAFLAAVLVGGGCGGVASPTTTADLTEAYATEYAVSARRALQDTRFAAQGDEWLIDLVVGACDRLEPGVDGDGVLAGIIARAAAEVPPGSGPDDVFLTEVVAAGVAAVCDDRVLAATTTTIRVPDPEDDYLLTIGTIADEAGIFVHPDVLLEAGRGVCTVLADGGGTDDAVLFAAEVVLGVRVSSLAELEGADGVIASDGLVLGSLLAAAATHLCPEHADAVAAGVAGIGAGR